MKRTTFTVAGKHPLLYLCRDYLIHSGLFALVPWSDDPDVCIYGGALGKGDKLNEGLSRLTLEYKEAKSVPTIVLSTSSMYSDKTRIYSTEAGDIYPMSAEDPTLLSRNNDKALMSLVAEELFLLAMSTNLVLRPFNVYGPDIPTGVVSKFINSAKRKEPLTIRGHGYQTRCFMHQEDFLYNFHRYVRDFAAGEVSGVKNVGTTESVSINRLGDSVWKLIHGPESETVVIRELRAPGTQDNQWKLPDLDEFITHDITLRKGLWRQS